MAGQFSTIAERRAHAFGFGGNHRAASLDVASPTANAAAANKIGNGLAKNGGSPPPADVLMTAATMINKAERAASAGAKSKGSPQKYFCPAHSQIRFGKLNFLITGMPADNTMDSYVADLERYHVTKLIRVCDVNYSSEKIREKGIQILDWQFDDGKPPSAEIIGKFMQLCLETFSASTTDCIAVHCVAGLGRGPVLVGIALLEAGMKYEEVVFTIRSQRRGALNQNQLDFLRSYKPANQLKKLRYQNPKQRKSCAIM